MGPKKSSDSIIPIFQDGKQGSIGPISALPCALQSLSKLRAPLKTTDQLQGSTEENEKWALGDLRDFVRSHAREL